MQQAAVAHLDHEIGKALGEAQDEFERAAPGLTAARDILIHFSEYALGEGRQQRNLRKKQGTNPADAARELWPVGYDPRTGVARVGTYEINVEAARVAAHQLRHAIYMAARAVDAAAPTSGPPS